MSDSDLNELFERSAVPAPRATLTDDILEKARRSGVSRPDQPALITPANDNGRWIKSIAAIAAVAIVGAFVWLQQAPSEPDEAQQWADVAAASGFGDLYDWVHEETPSGL